MVGRYFQFGRKLHRGSVLFCFFPFSLSHSIFRHESVFLFVTIDFFCCRLRLSLVIIVLYETSYDVEVNSDSGLGFEEPSAGVSDADIFDGRA